MWIDPRSDDPRTVLLLRQIAHTACRGSRLMALASRLLDDSRRW
jgi:hypothetical protein